MRILVVGPHDSPIIKRLVVNLKKRNHVVFLASYNAKSNQDVINLGDLKHFSDYLRINRLSKLVKKLQPDVVHAHVVNHYGIMSINHSKPLVVALWGSDVMLAPYSGNFFKKIIYRIINFLVLRRANQCHTSALHVAKMANKQFRGALQKTKVFYWGFPLEKPNQKIYNEVSLKLNNEFGITSEEKYIVFPRGLDAVYNPLVVAKIVNKLKEKVKNTKQIVVLKGFCDKYNEQNFSSYTNLNEITYVSRVLNSEELYFLYTNTYAHVSIPISDSLGSGVVEPSLLGSFPVLSNLDSYKEYSSNNNAHIMNSFDDCEIEKAIKIILEKIEKEKKISPIKTICAEATISKIEDVYAAAINNSFIFNGV